MLFRSLEIVFVCMSGGRSGRATSEAKKAGFEYCASLAGGMKRWNQLKLPVEL